MYVNYGWVCPTFECADEVRSPKQKRKDLEFLACRYCIGLTVFGIKLPEFTCLFFKTLRVRGLVGPSEVCITSDVVFLMLQHGHTN